ncbi:hypothetical protein ABIF26_006410 [Bradyrhizobium elkanii]|jgi:hypothetical protein|uniref:hypothetical protein n=1 Tax=Bradyrhizobium elkanii TaxID=29448 RepID=UPI0021690373|nr:hypothetical protein [Bradyrhizobium elkanii]MCS3690907.1 hypothetical protein [Bradyrhizobium elkanii]
MFGRLVDIDGTQIVVPCSPATPYSDVLRRAAAQLEREEQDNQIASLSARLSRAERVVIA